jgi:hypothetical protein
MTQIKCCELKSTHYIGSKKDFTCRLFCDIMWYQ